jgi:hypothetical protein
MPAPSNTGCPTALARSNTPSSVSITVTLYEFQDLISICAGSKLALGHSETERQRNIGQGSESLDELAEVPIFEPGDTNPSAYVLRALGGFSGAAEQQLCHVSGKRFAT